MKEGRWTFWILQDRPKQQCSCEYVILQEKGRRTPKEAPKLAGLPLTPHTQRHRPKERHCLLLSSRQGSHPSEPTGESIWQSIELKRDSPCQVSDSLEIMTQFLPLGMRMSILCLSHYCISETDTLSDVISSQLERNFASGENIPPVTPIPESDDIQVRFWIQS